MSKETKIGILVVVSFLLAFWGYKFLMGNNILKTTQYFQVKYNNVEQLRVSNPVLFNGLEIGTVNQLFIDPEDNETVIARFSVRNDMRIPQNAVAYLINLGVMGGKAIRLEYTGHCESGCLEDGAFIEGRELSLLNSMINDEDIGVYMDQINKGMVGLIDSLRFKMGEGDTEGFSKSIEDLQNTLQNLSSLTNNLNRNLRPGSGNLDQMLSNMNGISENLNANSEAISDFLQNTAKITDQITKGNLDETLGNTGELVTTLEKTLTNFQSTMSKLDESLSGFQRVLKKVSDGEGTIAKLMNDPGLYDNLEGVSKEMELLLQDFRLNPKRYVNVSVFGKKQKDYSLPQEDPADKVKN